MVNRTETFFTWIWRINGLLLLAAILTVGFFVISGSRSHAERHPAKIEVAGTQVKTEDLQLGRFEAVSGTSLLYAKLDSSRYGGGGSFGSGGGEYGSRNVLFFDPAGNKSRWLIAGNNQLITGFDFLVVRDQPAGASSSRERAVAIICDLYVPAEDSGTGAHRARRLAIALPDGRDLTTLVDSIDDFLGYHQLSDSAVVLFYVSGGSAKALNYDFAMHKVISDAKLTAE